MINIFSLREIKNAPNYVLQFLLVPIGLILLNMFILFIRIVFYNATEVGSFMAIILQLSSIGFITLFIIGNALDAMGINNIRK